MTWALPDVTGRSPVNILKVVVFPAPFTPNKPKHWEGKKDAGEWSGTVKQTNKQVKDPPKIKKIKETPNKQTNKQTNKQASKQTSKQTSKQESKQINNQTTKQANKQTNKQTNKQASKQKTLKTKQNKTPK